LLLALARCFLLDRGRALLALARVRLLALALALVRLLALALARGRSLAGP